MALPTVGILDRLGTPQILRYRDETNTILKYIENLTILSETKILIQKKMEFWPTLLYRTKPRTLLNLETRIQEVFSNIPSDFLQKTVHSTPGRMRKLVEATGAYVET